MRLGVTEVNRNNGQSGGFFSGAGTAGAEIIVAIALAVMFGPLILFFEILAIVKLWPNWDIGIAFFILGATLGGGLIVGILVFIGAIQKHLVTIKAMKNAAKLIHGTEQHSVYEHEGVIQGYSPMSPMSDMGIVDSSLEGEPEEEIPTTFKELVKQGWVGGLGQDIVFGFTEDFDPIGIPSPTSLGIAGVQGAGKTNTTLALSLATIAKYHGACKILVCDPHMEVAGDQSLWAKLAPLAPFLLTLDDVRATVPHSDHDYLVVLNKYVKVANPTVGGPDLLGWMEIVNTEMSRRRAGKVGEAWIIIMDEFAAVMETDAAPAIAHMLATLNNEARKMDMFAYLSSREWLATRTGGDSSLRNSIASFAVHATPASIAELIIPSDVARLAPKMKKGQVLFYSIGTTKIGNVVLVEDGDAENFVQQYPPRRTVRQIGTGRHETILPEATKRERPNTFLTTLDAEYEDEVQAVPEISAQSGLLPSGPLVGLPLLWTEEEVRQVQALWVGRLEVVDIAKRVYGAKAGPDLAQAKIKVRDILEWLVKRG